jgi:hypothetical protein
VRGGHHPSGQSDKIRSDIDMGYRYGVSKWEMWDGIWDIDMVIQDIDMGYGISTWEMTVSILSSWISIRDVISLCVWP